MTVENAYKIKEFYEEPEEKIVSPQSVPLPAGCFAGRLRCVPGTLYRVTDWYIGGHSLGGAMAHYAAKHTDELDGLVLLAAYSTAALTDSGLRVYAAYGSEDGVLNREKYEADRTNLPQDTTETVIDGGCHAGFGSYGAQKGDGTPTISAEEQQRQTADALAAWMNLQ